MLPALDAEWAATSSAAAELDAELPFPLSELVPALVAALERRPMRQRIVESEWAREHPAFTAALDTGPSATGRLDRREAAWYRGRLGEP